MGQVFSCEFCGISKNTFSYRSPPVAASREALVFLLQGTPCIIKGGTMSNGRDQESQRTSKVS